MSKNGSIRLHPIHGVNPTLGTCFWCGEKDGSVVLMGAAVPGQAPPAMCVSFEPCQNCKDSFARGITIVECTSYKCDNWQREMQKGAFPTGRWCVIREDSDFLTHITEPEQTNIWQRKFMFMEPDMFEACGLVEPKMEHPASLPSQEQSP